MKLNQSQKKSIAITKGNLRLIAGAGCGKTTILILKIKKLLLENIDPKNIFVITFTKKAAEEMKLRLAKQFNNVNSIYISTYHALCYKIIVKYIHHLPTLKEPLNIIDAKDQINLIRSIYQNKIEKTKKSSIFFKIKNIISRWKNLELDYCQIKENNYDQDSIFQQAQTIYKYYQSALQLANSIDYDDLILICYRLLQNNEILNEIIKNIKYLLVDEFQDTNDLQFKLIKLLAKNTTHFVVVGDPDQNIYTWRGANYKLLNNFEKTFPDCRTILLEENYRSSPNILNFANKLLSNNTKSLNKRIEKNLYTKMNFKYDHKPILYTTKTYKNEIQKLVLEIKKFVNKKKYLYQDIFVIYRSKYLSREIEQQFVQNHIPYQIFNKATSFFQIKEIKDLICLIKTFLYHDDFSITRSLLLIKNFGIKKIENLNQLKNNLNLNLYQLIVNHYQEIEKKTWNLISFFKDLFIKYNLENLNENFSIYHFMQKLLKIFDYYNNYGDKNDDDFNNNIHEFLKYLQEIDLKYKNKSKRELVIGFLDDILLTENMNESNNPNSVALMTIHAAKGLENKIVFIVSVCENVIPARKCQKREEIAEELRALYVACTRAKNHLILFTNYGFRNIFFRYNRNRSRFLDNLEDVLEEKEIFDL